MANPELRSGWRRFRSQPRAFWSLVAITGLFLVSLPAELICNDRPIVIHFNGRWYFPVFRNYTEADFGGLTKITPDYKSRRFLELLGRAPPEEHAEKTPPLAESAPESDILDAFDDEAGETESSSPDTGILDMFDAEEGEEHSTESAPDTFAILDDFDPEPWDVPLSDIEAFSKTVSEPAWLLWPPIKYDYARITRDSKSGRDALASPWGQVIPATGKRYGSSWLDGHYLGTDDRGRDVLARLIYGFRVSMIFGLLLALVGTVAGALLGALQGYFGGVTDLLGQRLTEIWGSLPQLYLLMILSSILARHIGILFFILSLTSWMGIASYMRAEFLRGRQLDYVTAARGLGASNRAIMFRHILPNSLTPIITMVPFAVSSGILSLTSLDFLNLGVPSPFPSLGELLQQGKSNLQATWIIIPTFVVLSTMLLLLNFVGDGLRNAFDPRRAVS